MIYSVGAISRFLLARESQGLRKWGLLRQATLSLRKLEKLALRYPDTEMTKYRMALGMQDFANNEPDAALGKLQNALDLARKSGIGFEQGQAHEYMAVVFASMAQMEEACDCISEAIVAYNTWGAKGKVARLEQQRRRYGWSK